MRELRPQREAPARWPVLLLVIVVVAVIAILLGSMAAPTTPRAGRHDATGRVVAIIALIAASGVAWWTLSTAPRRLDYRLRGRTLVVTTLLRQRRVPLSTVTHAEVVPFKLTTMPGAHVGLLNSHLPGYYVGLFPLSGSKRARVAVGVRSGRGVLLSFASEAPLLVAPEDPDALVALVQRYGRRDR